MATVSVVLNSSSHKINVLQQTTNTTNNDRREIVILKKHPPILPQPKNFNKEDILITNTKKKQKCGKETIRTTPQPMAVARRNARERNRVKQVNNGFANLRQHIPNFIAQAFESNNGRGNKKLSKVETLRMAVEYIRSLEDILALDDCSDNTNSTSSSFLSPSPSSPALTHTISYSYPDDDDLATDSTSPQYIRIDTATNTYQIIPNHLYDDSENLEPLNKFNEHILTDSTLDSDLDFKDLSLLNSIHTSDSLSPGIYSEQSLSPSVVDKSEQTFIPVFNTDKGMKHIKQESILLVKTEDELLQKDGIQW